LDAFASFHSFNLAFGFLNNRQAHRVDGVYVFNFRFCVKQGAANFADGDIRVAA